MAVKKNVFVEYIINAIEETKELHDVIRKSTKEKEENNSALSLEIDSKYMHDKYRERIAKAKLERLYSFLNQVAKSRFNDASDAEIEKYRNDKLNEINAEIDRYMLLMDSKEDNLKPLFKSKVEGLISKQSELKNEDVNSIRNRLSNKTIGIPRPLDEEAEVLNNIYRDEETLSEFFDLISEYRELKKELKMLKAEKIIVAKELIPKDVNYEIPSIDLESMLRSEALDEVEEYISKYISKAQEEEDKEGINFSKNAKIAYLETLKAFNDKKPIDLEKIDFFKNILLENAPRLYEKVFMEMDEYTRLSNKTFKTNEVEIRIEELKDEIANTKNELNVFIRKYYGDYYKNNNVYKPIASRVNGKFIYALGYQNLNNFVEYGVWPTREEIGSLRLTRILNKKTADDAIIKIEFAKSKYKNLYNEAVINKSARLAYIKDKMTRLVGNWENPTIQKIIDEHFSTKMMDEELLATATGVVEADNLVNNIGK